MGDNAIDILLRLQDELSPALAQAQQLIRQSATDLALHGAAGTKAFHDSDEAGRALISTLKDVAGAFGLAFTIGGAIEFLKSVAEEAAALQILSLQTHINVEDLQVLSVATKEFGVDGDQLGRAMFQLSQRIAGNDASVVTAYHLMGLSIDDVKDKDAMSLFLATERGLGTLSGAIQDAAAKDLYGGKLGASMVAFASGADEAVDKARKMNIASGESVKATADLVHEIDLASATLHSWVMEVEGGSAQGFNVLTTAADKGASKWALFAAVFQDWATSSTVLGPNTAHLATLLDHLNQTAAAGKDITLDSAKAHGTAAAALDAHAKAAQFMAVTILDSGKPLLDWQRDYLDQLTAMGLADAKNAAGVGVTAQQFAAYQANVKGTADALRILADLESEEDARSTLYYTNKIKQLSETSKASLASYSFGAQIAALEQLDAAEQVLAVDVEHSLNSEQERAKVREQAINQHMALMTQEMTIQLKQKDVVNDAIKAELDAQILLNAEWGLNAKGAIDLQKSALDILNQAMKDLHDRKAVGISQEKEEQVIIDAYTKQLLDEAKAHDTVASSSEASAARQVAANTTVINSYYAEIDAIVKAAAAASGLVSSAGTRVGSPNDGSLVRGPGVNQGTTVPINGIPTRDVGGPGVAGQPYYIGLGAQPELFIPSTSGTFVPNGAGGTSITNIYVMQPLGTPQAIASAVDDAYSKRVGRSRMYPA